MPFLLLISVVLIIAATICFRRTFVVLNRHKANVDKKDLGYQVAGLALGLIATVLLMILVKWQLSLHGILGFIVLGLMIVLLGFMFWAKEHCYAKASHPARRWTLIFGRVAYICWLGNIAYALVTKLISRLL